MTNEELHNQINETNLAVIRIEGAITNLTTAVNANMKASEKAEFQIDEKIKTIDKRIWGALISGIGGLLAALWACIKH